MLRDTKMNNFTKQATGLVVRKSWGYINSDFNEKDSDLADSSQILRLCHLLVVCASCHLWSRTSRGWGDQVTVLNNPRCDSDVVLAGCRENENIESLDTHTAISFQIDPLDWPLTVWYLRFCQFEKSFEKKNMDFYLNNVPLSISSSWGNSDFITIQLNHSWEKYEWNPIIYSENNIMTQIWQVLCCWPSNSAGPTPTMMIDIGRQEA